MSNRVKKLVFLALFIALAVVLFYFEFPILPSASHLQMDFSFVPILLVAMAYGSREAVLVSLVVNGIHFAIDGDLSGLPIGVLANFLATCCFLLVFVYFQKQGKLLVACVSATISVTLFMLAANYFWITPLYFRILGIPLAENFLFYCVMTVGLFNLIRWGIISIVNYILNSRLGRLTKQIK